MPDNRPRAREKHVTGPGAGVHRRGEGQGTGPVGSGSAFGGSSGGSGSSGGGGKRSGGGGLPFIVILLIALLGGGGSLGGLLGGGGGSGTGQTQAYQTQAPQTQAAQTQSAGGDLSDLLGGSGGSSGGSTSGGSSGSSSHSSSGGYGGYGSLYDMFANTGSSSTGWSGNSNAGTLNRNESPKARAHYVTPKGNGSDVVTLMVYMCGTDLESRNGMATNDLVEMTKANISDKVNLLVYTGGCRQWKNNVVSSSRNQIYKVEKGGLQKLAEENAKPMTDPATLSGFIRWCASNYPADRNMLIFWDHGGGSISGYGYDEKYKSSGSMNLSGINKALKDGGLKYDFIGFDACLMATAETALVMNQYADYMIASEETEPGIGWYYTNWLNALSKNTSMDTLDIGKQIIDDFVSTCATQCRGQQTTLSLTNLAELGQTLGADFSAFSKSTQEKINNSEYRDVSVARSNTREFAQSTRIDQIDLVHFARNVGTEEGKKLAETLMSAVKYNKTSSNMTNAYGLSIYFPLKKTSTVNAALKTYEAIGLDDSYADCIRDFASLQMSGQISTGGSSSPFPSLFGNYGSSGGSYGGSSGGSGSYGGSSSGGSGSYGGSSAGSYDSAEALAELLNAFLGGGSSGISGFDSGSAGSFFGRSLSMEDTAAYIADNRFDAGQLVWEETAEGKHAVTLSEDQWSLVSAVDQNVFVDDGEGYVDMGLDNLYSFGEHGELIADEDGTWLSINGQPVAYYHLDTTEIGDDYTITGYVPAKLNGENVQLILIFDNENPYGYIAGARPAYDPADTETVARGLTELVPGDKLDFLCDFYSYDGEFRDSYMLGKQMTVTDNMEISNTYLDSKPLILYRFTDIYDQHYWTPAVPKS